MRDLLYLNPMVVDIAQRRSDRDEPINPRDGDVNE
jgi:hypothetical protein